MKIEIAMATHRKIDYMMPAYCKKIQVNCFNASSHWEGYLHDDDDDNISPLNGEYCELTALYYLWKNRTADIKGLCHYRRLWGNSDNPLISQYIYKDSKHAFQYCLSEEQIAVDLNKYDIILAQQYMPFPDSVQDELEKYVSSEVVDLTCEVLKKCAPDYVETYEELLKSTSCSYFSMFIANEMVFDKICEFIFDILEKLTKELREKEIEGKRIQGYIGEILVYLYVKKNMLSCKYYNIIRVTDYFDNDFKNYIACIVGNLQEKGFLFLAKIIVAIACPRIYKRYKFLVKRYNNNFNEK